MNEKKSIVSEKSFAFSLEILSLYKELMAVNEFVISRQLLKSATSIRVNVEEALAGQTKKDFATKMSIASKEARETRYWWPLLNKNLLVPTNYSEYLLDIEERINTLTAIVKTTQSNLSPKTYHLKLLK